MPSNLDRFKKDLESLVEEGDSLLCAMLYELNPKEFLLELKKNDESSAEEIVKKLPSFRNKYQSWYSEALILIKQLLPDRIIDFISYFEKPKSRKTINFDNYKITDYLQSIEVPFTLGPDAAIPPK